VRDLLFSALPQHNRTRAHTLAHPLAACSSSLPSPLLLVPQNERRALEAVDSPFATKLVCAFQDKQNLYLALEYVENGELFHLLQANGPMREGPATFYASQLACALWYLHERSLVHRDVKPENILVDAWGYVKLTDFGFCKEIEDDRTYSVCG
jgi:serine/threonine protein kinase